MLDRLEANASKSAICRSTSVQPKAYLFGHPKRRLKHFTSSRLDEYELDVSNIDETLDLERITDYAEEKESSAGSLNNAMNPMNAISDKRKSNAEQKAEKVIKLKLW
jgi:hypothetical protein